MLSKTILITGATNGLGHGVARALAHQGHTLLVHGRSQQRLDAVAGELGAVTPVRTYRADLSSLEDVHDMIDTLLVNEPRIDVVIANAGIGGGPRRESEEGYELNFAVNYLSHYLLVTGLLERLRASAPARIVLVSSIGQMPIDFTDVMLERHYDGMRAYCQSKLAEVAFGLRLAQTLDPAEVTVNSLHPGTEMHTGMVSRRDGDPIERGIANVTRLAVAPELEGVTGAFYDREHRITPHNWAADQAMQEALWELSARLTA